MSDIANAATIPIDLRNAAAFGAALIGGLLLLQFAHRRNAFILAWAAGWLALAVGLVFLSRDLTGPLLSPLVAGGAQLLGLVVTTCFFWSGDLYRHTHIVRMDRLKYLAPVALWLLFAPFLFGMRVVAVSGQAVNALLFAATATMYGAVLIERRMMGAGVIAFTMLGLAASNVMNAFVDPGTAATSGYVLNLFVVVTILAALGGLGIHLMVFEDMTYELRVTNRRLEAAREELLQAAITDPLTGCHNRRFLEQVMDRELQRHKRFDLPLSLLFIDINRFKAVNDSLGHDAGDRVLQYVAQFLKRHIREADYVFRWGGDEFLVLITCPGDEARRKAGVLKAAFDAAPETINLPPGIGLSVGSIEVPRAVTDLMPLVREADERMYRDKQRI